MCLSILCLLQFGIDTFIVLLLKKKKIRTSLYFRIVQNPMHISAVVLQWSSTMQQNYWNHG